MSDLVDKAVRDARALAQLAQDSVKNEIYEQLEPGVRKLVDRVLKESLGTKIGGNGIISEGDNKMAKDELDLESISGMFPGISETEETDGDELDEAVDEDEDELDEAEIPSLDEMESLEGDLDEEIEIDEAELKKVYDEALALEVKMTSGLKDLDLSGKEEVDQSNALHDVKGGEQYFGDIEPPAKKDWTVKEVRSLVRQGLAENKRLALENRKLKEAHTKLVRELSKLNLFNTKMLHVNKFFAEHKLSKGQQKVVIESIDRAGSSGEVQKTYKTLEATFRAAGVVSESRKPKANSQRVRRPGANQTVIRESADNSANPNKEQYSRWGTLAGLLK